MLKTCTKIFYFLLTILVYLRIKLFQWFFVCGHWPLCLAKTRLQQWIRTRGHRSTCSECHSLCGQLEFVWILVCLFNYFWLITKKTVCTMQSFSLYRNSSLMPVAWKYFELEQQYSLKKIINTSFFLNIAYLNCYCGWWQRSEEKKIKRDNNLQLSSSI